MARPGRHGLNRRERAPSRRRGKVFAVLPTAADPRERGLRVRGDHVRRAGGRTTTPATSLFAASCLIFLAMLFDALDGSTARWANRTSEFGAQLDSLCDAISFGAAPAFLMLQFSVSYGYHPRLLWMVAALYVVCTVLRLARFNVETDEDEKDQGFSGLPSPAAAAVVASFPFMVFGPAVLTELGVRHAGGHGRVRARLGGGAGAPDRHVRGRGPDGHPVSATTATSWSAAAGTARRSSGLSSS